MESIYYILAFIAGFLAKIIYQFLQTKESLKQTVYNKKLILYGELLSRLVSIQDLLQKYNVDQTPENKSKVLDANYELHNFLMSNLHIVSVKIMNSYQKSIFCQESDLTKKLKAFPSVISNIANNVRDELGIEKLSIDFNSLLNKI